MALEAGERFIREQHVVSTTRYIRAMTDEYDIGTPIDEDYIGVEAERADVSYDREKPDSEETIEETEQRSDRSYRMDVRGGNGAASKIEELIDQNAVIDHDGRASTRTFFRSVEAPEDKEDLFERLTGWQEDKWDSETNYETRQHGADRMRWIGDFCGQLEMTPHQRRRVEHIVEGLDMSHMAHYSSQKVIVAVISIVADEDASRHGERMRDRSDFRKILEAVGSDLTELKSIRKLVRRQSDSL